MGALGKLGARPRDVRRIALTHCHVDHSGSAAELVDATGVQVLAGALDAPFVRGTVPGPEAVLSDSERALHEQILAGFTEADQPALRHVPVDVELRDGRRPVPPTRNQPFHAVSSVHVSSHVGSGPAVRGCHCPASGRARAARGRGRAVGVAGARHGRRWCERR